MHDEHNNEHETRTQTPEPDETAALRLENQRLKDDIRVREARESLAAALSDSHSPQLLFEAARPLLQFDDDNRLANLHAIVGELRRRYPEQFRAAGRQSIGAEAPTAAPMLDRETLARMRPAEIAKLDWGTVREVLAGRA